MSVEVVVRPEARCDIDDQAEYYLIEAGLEVALRFLAAADTTFALLATQSGMGRQRRFRDPSFAGARWVLITGFYEHMVFYRQMGAGVEVLRVLHGRRDLEAILGDVEG